MTLFDLDYVSSVFGKERWFDARYWYHSKHAFSMDAYGLVACQASRLIAAIKGKAKKCLVLDLDNTLWGGVIGDEGLDEGTPIGQTLLLGTGGVGWQVQSRLQPPALDLRLILAHPRSQVLAHLALWLHLLDCGTRTGPAWAAVSLHLSDTLPTQA